MGERICIRYHFGGKWVTTKVVEYVGGSYHQFHVGYDANRLDFWSIHNFYKKLLGIENFRLWFKESSFNNDGVLHEINGYSDVVRMMELNKNYSLSEVYCEEEGENVTDLSKLLKRLHDALLPEEQEATFLGAIQEGEWSEDSDKENLEGGEQYNSGEESDKPSDENIDETTNMASDIGDEGMCQPQFTVISPRIETLTVTPTIDEGDSDIDEPHILDDTELFDVRHSSDEDVGDDYPWFNGVVSGLCTGMKFQNVTTYRKALRDWCIENGVDFKHVKNTKERVTVVCKDRCGFKVHASLKDESGVFQIKTWRPLHHCSKDWKNHLVTSGYIARKYLEKFRDNPDWSVDAIQKTLEKRLSCTISIQQCYRAKRKAKKLIEGDVASQYFKLEDYAEMVRRTNEGSTVNICTQLGTLGDDYKYMNRISDISIPRDPVPLFLYMYVRFAAQKQAFFSGLRPFMGLDGCFLKGVMGGQLLSAVAKDGNNNLYPLAIAVVDAEDKNSWGWFLKNLIDDFGHPKDTHMVFMSDKHKTCTCRMWELKGFPCIHAVAAIKHCRLKPEDFVDNCYTRETYLTVYNHKIMPIPSVDEWPMTEQTYVYPPVVRKPAGRPRKKRKRAHHEPKDPTKTSRVGKEVRCGNCGRLGHNSRGCKAAVIGETKWQRRVRLQTAPKEKKKKSTVDVAVGS